MSKYQRTFQKLNIPDTQTTNYVKNEKLCDFLQTATDRYLTNQVAYSKGSLLINAVSKVPEAFADFRKLLFQLISNDEITSMPQVEEFIKFLRTNEVLEGFYDPENPNYDASVLDKIKKFSGVGVSFTEEQVKSLVKQVLDKNKSEIEELRHSYNFGKLMLEIKEIHPDNKFIDGKSLKMQVDAMKLEMLGPKDARDAEIEKKLKENKKKGNQNAKDKKKEDTTKAKKDNMIVKDIESSEKLSSCIGREIKLAINSELVKNKHAENFGKNVWTRFPPEPNGYLHIGHAKAIRFNFNMAKESNGHCYLRFDDTNPAAESQEYIDNIIDNIKWLGYTPYTVTYSSNYFTQLYEFAEQLIKGNYAYVDHLEAEEMKTQRYNKIESKYRNRSVEESLKEFRRMRRGYYNEGEATLRLKIDMNSPNPTMRDPVAYRVIFHEHPRTKKDWCVYPTYDFTHCIVDSLEGITHSLCTLEFEIRRDLYYWTLDKLNIWKPSVWEYSRLNVSYSFLSKRKILKCVTNNIVQGWDDPRLFTLNGLRRRGFSPDIINAFVDLVGVARKGNDSIIDLKLFEHVTREVLDTKCARTMAIVEPLKIRINNLPVSVKDKYLDIPVSIKDESKGTRKVLVTEELYINAKDWRDEDSKNYFGMALNKNVGLKYIGVVKVVSKNNEFIECEYVSDGKTDKPKGWITWLSPKESVDSKINVYKNLITEPNANKLGDDWMKSIDHASIETFESAKVHKSIAELVPETQIQIEREGYFVTDSKNHSKEHVELNMIVTLTDKTNF